MVRTLSAARRRDLRNGLLFVSPWLVGLAALNLWPLLRAFSYSLSHYSVLNPPVYIGATNYRMMVEDPLFWRSLWNTLIYAAMALPLWIIGALALALLVQGATRWRPVFRAIIFVPSLIPLVAAAVIWAGLFNGDFGIINYMLEWVSVEGPNWLGDPTWMKPAVALMGFWGVGNAVVIYMAGLQEVPRSLYEAAEVDGANRWQTTWHVTLPMLSPVIYFNLIISCIFVLQIFAQPYVMFDPNGGASQAGLFYTMHLVNEAFIQLRMGYACAMAWVLFVMIAALTYAAHRFSRKHVYYGGM